jgi:hypothetical protein
MMRARQEYSQLSGVIIYGNGGKKRRRIIHASDAQTCEKVIISRKRPLYRDKKSMAATISREEDFLKLAASPLKTGHRKRRPSSNQIYLNDIFFHSRDDGLAELFYLVSIDRQHIDTNLDLQCKRLFHRLQAEINRSRPNPKRIFGDLLLKNEYQSENRDTLFRNLSINNSSISKIRRFGEFNKATRKQPATIGPEYDYLSMNGWEKSSTPQGIANIYNYLTRLKTLATKGPAILATARNEAVYLPDWCAYHFAIGFDKIFLYTNSNNDKTLEVAVRLQELGFNIAVTQSTINNSKSSPQIKAYRYALSIDSDILNHSWCATIDLDEYFAIKINSKVLSVSDWISSVCTKSLFNCDIIAIPWIFASLDNDFIGFDDCDKPITQRVQTISAKDKHIKSIFKPQPFTSALPHHPLATMHYTPFAVMPNGEMYGEYQTSSIPSISEFPTFSNGVIMHYHHKSMAEFIWKKSRTGGARMIADIVPDRSALRSIEHAKLEKRHKAINWINRVRATEKYAKFTAMMRSDVALGQYLAESKEIMNAKYQSWIQQ